MLYDGGFDGWKHCLRCRALYAALLEKAWASYDDLAIAPSLDDAYRALGWIQILNNDPIDAIENLNRSVRLCPVMNGIQRGMLGTAYRNAGKYKQAVRIFEDCVEEYPEFISARAGLVSTYSLLGEEKKAQEELRELLRRKPDYTIAQYSTPNFYRDKAVMTKWTDALRSAGMPAG